MQTSIAKALATSAITVLSSATLFGSQSVTHLSGKVSPDIKIGNVVLMKESEHPTMVKKIAIPVIDGKFTYDLDTDTVEAYYLIPAESPISWSSSWIFFSEGGDVFFDIIEDKSGSNEAIVRSEMMATKEYQEHIHSLLNSPSYVAYMQFSDSVYDNHLAYTPEFYSLLDSVSDNSLSQEQKAVYRHKMDSLRNAGNYRSEIGLKLDEEAKAQSERYSYGQLKFAESNKGIPGLLVLMQKFWFEDDKIDKYIDIFNQNYKDKYQGHPYTVKIAALIDSKYSNAVAVGGKYPDVEATDTLGNRRHLSEFIDGKIAIIDLWASWCGPCRRNSIALKPLYDKYASKGLAIIGIAREIDNDKAMRMAIERDGYQWPSLVEINDSDLIWSKFGIPNAPGRTLLVDRSGTILAIDPEISELEKILDLLLK